MAPTNDNDYGQFIYLDIEDYIEEYGNDNRAIYCKAANKNYMHSRYADKLTYLVDYTNNYWLENIKLNIIGMFVVGVTIYFVL
jgi:hypothetical protein